MSTYTVTHLESGETFTRPAIHSNPFYGLGDPPTYLAEDPAITTFHQQLPEYAETKLHPLPSLAQEHGFSHVFLKDESARFGLPSFKIAGASWAVHRAISQRIGFPPSTSLPDLKKALAARSADPINLVACTDGNWGRAVARMCRILGVDVTIYVPAFMNAYTQGKIREEGAEVVVVSEGSYDDAISTVQERARETGALLVMDTSWPGYEEVPVWVTQGYLPLLTETDRQVAAATNGKAPDLVLGSTGVGSWMHAVTSHYALASPSTKVVTVEPDTAASFKESLHCGDITPIKTGDTIMCGMNCGTTSTIAWPVLRSGIPTAATVTDRESHESVEYLKAVGVDAGPCGAASIAALRKICYAGMAGTVDERKEKVVVLFSTEGNREYEVSEA
ncbi:tryptophan synthase beta subunit-like PLP-dependent enzyme [Hortaea werneckii]|uniref:Tryptophan synthase beta chain-like PALP domain-containing protein n=1 Tax=Hortaea werneckii TaxID=91943 RepID=A0A3M7GK26_HORWE|nr:tryptophan synthase beta subunit-like PLP-dependent enzyme [Hortaea werneckii]KAI7568519.1 tryptophan synthase beta subunit-like PLP-dependent enzyme [Hortaea werneckii]KAI7621246.1 tryptophan synthase beta subunit-like PLP-dependent enzyme [Hortaea werneckii]KAI7630971.1 tryptophan synthase beta subunit-like PLP-dependent enzyme [Hortaea werneckii]KAI7677438.1 tryptophan synthase beta subunit-like PLP-dependent enzyme [Hortaea werneckii]